MIIFSDGVSRQRPLTLLLLILTVLFLVNLAVCAVAYNRLQALEKNRVFLDIATSALGLTDLCVATEARYTRHPAVSDFVVPFMDHPMAIEHFPTGSFWAPPSFNSLFRESK